MMKIFKPITSDEEYRIVCDSHTIVIKRDYVRTIELQINQGKADSKNGTKDKRRNKGKITNKRIRHENINPEECGKINYSTYKKKYGPKLGRYVPSGEVPIIILDKY